jgi:hypothetical protein
MTREGRAVGNRPWPFESVPNPDGDGLVWRPIPERAAAVREAVAALTKGRTSIAAVARDWTERGFRPPQGGSSWSPASVRVLLTSPTLTGATPQGDDVVRNADGTVRRDRHRAILTPAEHRALLSVFESNARHRFASGSRPIRLPLLWGIATCDSCGHRLTANRPKDGRPGRYICQIRECSARVAIDLDALNAFTVDAFLAIARSQPVEAWEHDPAASTDALDDLHEALAAVQEALVASDDDAEEAALLERRRALRAAIREAEEAVTAERRPVSMNLLDVWESIDPEDDDDAERRRVIGDVFASVAVRRTTVRRGSKVADRVTLTRATL